MVFICADRGLNSDIYGENINIRLYVEKGGYQYDDNRETAENSYEILYSKTSGVTVPSILKIKGRLSDACYYDAEYCDNLRLKLSNTELYLLHKYILKKQNPDNEYYFPNYNKKEYYRINYYLNSAKKLQNISADSKVKYKNITIGNNRIIIDDNNIELSAVYKCSANLYKFMQMPGVMFFSVDEYNFDTQYLYTANSPKTDAYFLYDESGALFGLLFYYSDNDALYFVDSDGYMYKLSK